MRILSLGSYAVMALAFAGAPQSHAGTIEGIWSNPILAGNIIDATSGALSFHNNTASAVSSISNGISSAISWGTWNSAGITNPPGVPDTVGCAALAAGFGVPCQSTITFTGNTLPADTLVPFSLGTLTYSNGTSNLDSLIFGATLTFFDSANPGVSLGSDFVQFVTTNNTGSDTQNADYVAFSGLAGQSFNVIEGATAQASLNGIIDDVVLTSLTLLSAPTTGFIGSSPSIPLTAPEPASIALLCLGLAGIGIARRRH